MPTSSALAALQNLRNPDSFQWYVIPLFIGLVVFGALLGWI